MIKRKLIITAGAAVLFSCVVFATVHMRKTNSNGQNGDNVISTTQVSEEISINNGGVNRNPQTETMTEDYTETTTYQEESVTDVTSIPETTPNNTEATEPIEESTTEKVSDIIQTEESSTTLEETETTVDETTTEKVTDSSVNVNEEDNTKFSFSKIIVDKSDYDYYSKLVNEKGYIDIQNR